MDIWASPTWCTIVKSWAPGGLLVLIDININKRVLEEGGGMLWLKRFKRWCNNLQELILLIFVAHNIFDHIKWHEVENARLGVGATTTSWTITKVKWGGEWSGVCNQTWGIKSKFRKVLIPFTIWRKRLQHGGLCFWGHIARSRWCTFQMI